MQIIFQIQVQKHVPDGIDITIDGNPAMCQDYADSIKKSIKEKQHYLL